MAREWLKMGPFSIRFSANRIGGNDTIVSGSGHDRIEAGYGDDDITGGKGDDLLIGSYGSDTYRYNLGDGFDIIDDYDSSNTGAIDKIVFGEGITKDDLKFACRQDHLFITIKDDPTQGIRINFYFNDSSASYYKIEKLVFADGSEIDMNTTNLVLTQTDTAETVKATEFDDTIYAKGGNDTIYAKGGNDTIYGGDGNDRIEAGSGNDILVGGKGDDTLIGSTGSDTYLWNLGDGFDTIDDYEDPSVGNVDKIVFGEGITFNDLTFRNKNGGLDIYVNGDETQGVHINFVFNGSNESYYQIEQLQFADGSTVELSQIGLTFDQTNGDEVIKTTAYDDVINAGAGNDNITALAGNDIIFGEDGNDTINAGSGNDNISGGKGNDTLMGGTGNDTYYYNLGDGWDTIEDNDGTEGNNDTISFGAGKIKFGEGISLSDLNFRAEGIFGRHCPFDAFNDSCDRAAVIIKLFVTIFYRCSGSLADVLVICTFVGILKTPPAGDIQNKNGFIFSLMTLNIAQHLLQSSAAGDIQTTFAAIGISSDNFIIMVVCIFSNGCRLIFRRILLMFCRHPNIHGCRNFIFIIWVHTHSPSSKQFSL